MADTLNVRDPNGNIVPVSVDDLTSLNGSPVTDVHIQRFKAVFGSDSVGQDVDAAHPLPVDAQSVVAVLNTILTELQAKLETGQPVDLSAGTLAALENVTATIAGTVDLSAATLTALETIQIGNFPATQTVSGTVQVANFPVTQPVSGAVSVSNLPATQPVSGAVTVSNLPATQAVSAAALPLPGGAATDASLTNGTAQVNLAAPTASAPSSVAASTSSVTLAAANATRRGLSVYNDGTANLFVKHGATASASSFTVKVPAGGLYELPAPYYRGVVDGIWDVANGSARITELS